MRKIRQLSDPELMREIMSDNFKAFTELYNRYKHVLFQFVIRLSHGNYSMAEEIVQEAFIIIWENRKKIVIEYSFQSYLKKISRNLFLRETGKRVQEQLMIAEIENVREAENFVENEVELNLLLEEVERIISMLPPARQRVYRLKHIEHLSQKEIANRLNISENTVESHLKQSTKFLVRMLKTTRGDLVNSILLLFYFIVLQLF
ncbi:RNA polymerase sigma-70 factor (family 1) [Parabacteroides sp. PF5-5]|uniref:RNA polymerase sigma factor n=1 Tax=unclassified Parabacteroides TaxID=2649774 RepID=UPI0024761133|nr:MULTISPECIES: sigma-70 family RNA polymerase sigma factor [unclassified Parabacteroides]MDH6304734.1 RNA polymerase sigma-70 factor (family 1) [Parabacteroides sp. PH5-39]MDH6315651.1 RNA polymerase sigma-70 factor (family 1) [Parabacteroides sp. PF5-13]MDH6319312.1 RNA polymerase sigma-70 factor (family 1) [Parabacteroides sp. PH5-13]MDH6323043.1 RNA polymerase sigma-70 factor (family 1) [Parabacteroides sp. PH5-8]MDH6326844.1 RNA polymerase sigma-70 factor (family 1) [Parabacteroides sp. 